MALYIGQDFSTFFSGSIPAMDLSFTPIDGVRAAQETILRKLRSPPGSFDDRTWGLDILQYQNASLSSSDLAALQGQIAGTIEEEEYVSSSSVECVLVAGTLVVDIVVELANKNSFTMALALTPDGLKQILTA